VNKDVWWIEQEGQDPRFILSLTFSDCDIGQDISTCTRLELGRDEYVGALVKP